MITTISAVTTMFLGALADWVWGKTSPSSHTRYSTPIAAGFIAGEALVAVVIPILVVLGVMSLPQ